MPYWLKTFSTGYTNPKTGGPGITSSQQSEIVSLLSAGTFFGVSNPLGSTYSCGGASSVSKLLDRLVQTTARTTAPQQGVAGRD